MASRTDFKAALVFIYFNALTTKEIIINEFDDIPVLRETEDNDIEKLICYIGRWRGPRYATYDVKEILTLPHSISLYPF